MCIHALWSDATLLRVSGSPSSDVQFLVQTSRIAFILFNIGSGICGHLGIRFYSYEAKYSVCFGLFTFFDHLVCTGFWINSDNFLTTKF